MTKNDGEDINHLLLHYQRFTTMDQILPYPVSIECFLKVFEVNGGDKEVQSREENMES